MVSKMNEDRVVLSLKGITKQYPGVRALNNISTEFREAEIHCIVGENGAGKSTLIKTISGAISPDDGEIVFEGNSYRTMNPHLSRELGIDVIYQELNLVEDLSISENIFLGQRLSNKKLFDISSLNKKAKGLLNQIDLDINPEEMAGNLSVSNMKLVEIAKAISTNVKVLILDEPTASLTDNEADKLLELLLLLKSQGCSIIYISHKLDEIFRIGDRYTILRDGEQITCGNIKDTNIDEMISHMVGRTMVMQYPERTHKLDEKIFEVRNLVNDEIHDISFDVRKGEIFGIGGLVGSKRTETLYSIFGLTELSSGDLFLNGEKIHINNPKEAINMGLGFLTEDRKREGLLMESSIVRNVSLPILQRISKKFLVDTNKEEDYAKKFYKLLNIKAPNIFTLASSLSGGNQQKVVLAKWLAADCKVLFLDEPTLGVDVGAKMEIYKLINDLTSRGVAIVMVSSEIEELFGMADRILVLHEGHQMKILSKPEFNEEVMMKYASGIVENN